ncbi:hypothetical protein EMIHUDRAFT_372733 [Emiliania huxleyi CCMP1516]|uniref:Uncharacterized protein n=2 Tax=Emiliania huxleyi TaxID=2903 RepID=A0A0D3IN93_EMIH1|nr:hypothetical protein EMIHUDRAFT_311445 [Emiliania huxleyi CCMP1516]XP_005765157.1 hypothetical protein EMIHUDRAFT_371257 [Emiliania huxleyi CCMP1516]XP_005793525.1 hypothetical protein EMIHUDRAFT_372733 [Emiliania huxleyi CCMP1516]EOD12051.1 hypothetical protein EMIHUDRAFT_311445 [Emiliania huxleyi CCMP1516]EOD12728.1 hypothetical protein EMIHUDRAFT_371257 [Emiliania huxleyi CCMP1516]EOD41096.1 hypothetical protein EMIHUDRAFT_372733 [Emiliania huxleyi CCMP1516]|eukprot:XP_005764480.1 hypothetical protein EMIHUDRAFT_311445 [Emiliania huxleyi CCMP1516]
MLALSLLLAGAFAAGLLATPPGASLHASCAPRRAAAVVMGRKGRPRAPGGPGGGAVGAMPQQEFREPDAPPDGTPLFYLYARNPKTRVMWYPVSVLRGDGQSKGLVGAWLGSPLAKGVFKERLDEGVARSIFESERRLTDMARQQYPAIKKLPSLEWGYKIVATGVSTAVAKGELPEQKVQMVTKELMQQESWADKAQKAAKSMLGQA